MNKNTKLTLEDLIAKKEQVQANKKVTRELYVESLQGTITIQKPTLDLISDMKEMEDIEGTTHIIYNCIISPDLHSKQLQDAYKCVEPTDIVQKLFELGEIDRIGEEIMKLAGYKNNSISVVEKLKN